MLRTIDGESLAEKEKLAVIMPGKGENPSMSMTYSYETVYVNPKTHECKLESAEGYEAKKVLLSERIVVSMEIESTVTATRKAVVDKSAYIFLMQGAVQ